MKNNKATLTAAIAIALSSSANAWYSTDFSTYTYANAGTYWQPTNAPYDTMAADGWTNRFTTEMQIGGTPLATYTWAPDGTADTGATGGMVATGGGAGFGQGGPTDAYGNFFANQTDSNTYGMGNVTTQLERTQTVMANAAGDYAFTFDYIAAQEPSSTTGGTYGSDGNVTVGAFVEVWGGEYWWSKGRTEVILNDQAQSWTSGSVNFSLDMSDVDPSACNWDGSQGCDTVRIGFFNIVDSQAEAIDTGIYIDNLAVTAVTAVPVPAAAWLMGSALLGLAGMKRARKQAFLVTKKTRLGVFFLL